MPLTSYITTKLTERPLRALEKKFAREGKWRQAQQLRRKQFELQLKLQLKQDFPDRRQLSCVQELIKADKQILFQVMAHAASQASRSCKNGGLPAADKKNPSQATPSSSTGKAKKARFEVRGNAISSKRNETDETELYSDGSREAIWIAEQNRHKILSKLQDGPLKRAYLSNHKNPGWHLSEWQRSECVVAGGCCARDCGCCARPRCSDLATPHYGHCLSSCICCAKIRGFEILFDTLADDKMLPEFDVGRWNGDKRVFGGRLPPHIRVNEEQSLLECDDTVPPLFYDIEPTLAGAAARSSPSQGHTSFASECPEASWQAEAFRDRVAYIHNWRDCAVPYEAQVAMVQGTGVKWVFREIETGHSAQMSAPEELARVILEVVSL
ncbi:uncharacterized protein BO97DRAFT_425478 [Aspergillus homomorphus CBS 101889]|uniref:AB hydrolase-1 domain-containing protein n=1 Tax=Aspergillus homomorphus (strain CBS 101889) TaxID=1450537 RepID=A0A395HU77_ASPHC|nr:hypothetical protein BO97DRAFT_425478 [Aspergillus homomorphus CBS 101889]RAL11481.1 hypothetical protein BO97DRAFT_425478 [Aspergillus homomorphus CBS 101889]